MDRNELMELFYTTSPEEFKSISAKAEEEFWTDTSRYCGKCGAKAKRHENPVERAFVCPECGNLMYPKIAPAVIVLITKGDKILLQRNSHYSTNCGTLVAGFVDPGENLEEAVRREAKEEANIEVKDIRYVGSQTWPFPSNLMVAFRAEYAGGELRADGDEVISSAWYSKDALPAIPRPGSIAHRMISAWMKGE